MEPEIKWVANRMPKSEDRNLEIMSLENVSKARAFHQSFPQYSVTPLANLSGMAERLGLAASLSRMSPTASASTPSRCSAAPLLWPATSQRRPARTSPR